MLSKNRIDFSLVQYKISDIVRFRFKHYIAFIITEYVLGSVVRCIEMKTTAIKCLDSLFFSFTDVVIECII